MNQTQFVAEVYKIASAYIPAIDDSSSFQDVVKDLEDMKDKAMRWEIFSSSFKPEPELPHIQRPTLRETQARRQGQL